MFGNSPSTMRSQNAIFITGTWIFNQKNTCWVSSSFSLIFSDVVIKCVLRLCKTILGRPLVFFRWYYCRPRKDNSIVSVFLKAATTNNTGQNVNLFIHLVYNGEAKADRNGAKSTAWLDPQSGLIFPGGFMPSRRQNCVVKARFYREPKSKWWWCH